MDHTNIMKCHMQCVTDRANAICEAMRIRYEPRECDMRIRYGPRECDMQYANRLWPREYDMRYVNTLRAMSNCKGFPETVLMLMDYSTPQITIHLVMLWWLVSVAVSGMI